MIGPLDIWIGWDSREDIAFEVCRHSLVRTSAWPLHIAPLRQNALRHMGLYTRAAYGTEVKKDIWDDKPFSTEFTFTRFLVPALQQYEGWALFCDCDFLFREDVQEVFELADPKYAVMCAKHRHEPTEAQKMDGQVQSRYPRKNWSSFVLWNCSHPANQILTPDVVNAKDGSWLHGFRWLEDAQIGALPLSWNWLEGSSDPTTDPKAVHFTRGGPWFPEWQDVAYADEWRRERDMLRSRGRTAA